jgi:HD-GYP domain-containing protein (c-di-GMP phosphodiesterase class II)
MTVFQLPADVLRVGEPIPFALRDRSGLLLVARGVMVASEDQRRQLAARELYVDEQDGEMLKRAMAGKLDSMVRQNALIGAIAKARPTAVDINNLPKTAGRRLSDPSSAWSSLHLRLSALLRDPAQPDFRDGVVRMQAALLDLLDRDADDGLMLLFHGATHELRDYSVFHAMLVTVLCDLAARHVSGWTDDWRQSLRCAALTMNVAMTSLQTQLASQDSPVTDAQRAKIESHASDGVALLRTAGVTDALWLGAVEHHHTSPPGPLAARPAAEQLARLIERADIFAARLSPRKRRPAMSATAAAKAAYIDENQQPDEAGSAIIKATGLYPPGSLVRLRSGEIAVVLRRGRRANEPAVASIVNAAGHAIAEPSLRNTRLQAYQVTGGVAAHEVKVRLNPERLLKLA